MLHHLTHLHLRHSYTTSRQYAAQLNTTEWDPLQSRMSQQAT